MRYLIIIMILLAISPELYGAEISIGLDRCVILNDHSNQSAESMAAIYFNIPDSLAEKEIIYSEIEFPFSINGINDSSLYEFMLYPATGEWSEQTIDYDQAVELIDSLMVGAYTVRLTNLSEFHIDVTNFVTEVTEENRTNHGLIALANLLGDDFIRLPGNAGNAIKNTATVKITFK